MYPTLHKHFSNMGLLNGSGILGKKEGSDGAKLLQDDYKNYISQLSTKSGYVIVTPDDFGGRKPTVGELETLAKKLGSDMIIVDQLSLMTDQRRADTPRISYNNIYRRFVIATDNDEAGRKAARRIKDKLIPLGFRFFNLKWLTDLKDVNELIQNYGDDFEDYLHRY